MHFTRFQRIHLSRQLVEDLILTVYLLSNIGMICVRKEKRMATE